MRRAFATVAATAVIAASMAGCSTKGGEGTTPRQVESANPTPSSDTSVSGSASESASGSPSGSPTDTKPGTKIAVTVHGDQVTPNGKRVEVGTGETVTLEVDSDRAGELHVHSTPGQEFHFDKGHSTITFTVDKPGIVDVEEHEADMVVLQLQVS